METSKGLYQLTIEAIIGVITPDELDLLKITRGQVIITFEDQLRAYYDLRVPLYTPSITRVRAAAIMNNQKLNIEKLKLQEDIIETLSNPKAFFKTSEQKTKGDKTTALISTVNTVSDASSYTQNKSRSGAAENYEEYDLIGDGDRADEETLRALLSKDPTSLAAKNIELQKEENGGYKLIFRDKAKPVKKEGEEEDKGVPLNEVYERDIALNTLDLNTNRVIANTRANSNANSGKQINSGKSTEQVTETYVKAEAMEKLVKFQYIDIREQILKSFDCLFRDRPYINPLCR